MAEWPSTPTELVGVWERRWICRPGLKAETPGAKDASVVVRYISAASAFVDIRVAQARLQWPAQAVDPTEIAAAAADRRAEAFAGVSTLEDGVIRWHAILNLEGSRSAEGWRAAEAGKPLPTEDAGTMEAAQGEQGVWREHAWPDAGKYTEEWAKIDGGPSLAARRGDGELLVVCGDWFGYARDTRGGEGGGEGGDEGGDEGGGSVCFAAGRVSTGWLVASSAAGPEEGRRLVLRAKGGWTLLPGATLATDLDELLAGPDEEVGPGTAAPLAAAPPAELRTARLLLRPLGAAHAEPDYAAVLDGLTPEGSPLQGVFARRDTWPFYGMTLAEDLFDLRRHEAEFAHRLAFAYTVLDAADEGVVLGCCYVNPPTKPGYDAECMLWIRPSAAADLDAELEASLRHWLAGPAWPEFGRVGFPGRDLADGPSGDRARCWDYWEALPFTTQRYPRIATDAKTVVFHLQVQSGLIP